MYVHLPVGNGMLNRLIWASLWQALINHNTGIHLTGTRMLGSK